MKRSSNCFHLLIGVASLALAAYFFHGLALNGKSWWQQQSFFATPVPKSAKPGLASDDSTPSAAKLGESGESDDAAGADNAPPVESGGPPAIRDHVGFDATALAAGIPHQFLHRRFAVKGYEFFEFALPAQAVRPELQGTVRLAARQDSESNPSVELLLMNAQQFGRFLNRRPVTAMLSTHPASGDEIDWRIKPAAGDPQKYYLVFRNSAAAQGPSIVDADFSVSFE